MQREENVVLVDEKDNEIGLMGKTEAHKKGLLHRAISVFILNSNGEWLLQRRALDKYHSGGLWTNACCTHPQANESNIDAANRRLMEEMGMDCSLKELFCFTYKEVLDNELTEHEVDHVFIGITDVAPTINVAEVAEFKYIAYQDLEPDIANNPSEYTAWFRRLYARVQEHIQTS
ncbi:MAG: isopentenyl-diphosphate Delta-isomerase [Bacteroidales bacterium]|nr:isopentenyl-diphosphate Delta-isomerase [Bacteroidales bacterium]